jgi:hypothetical protein
MMHLDPTNGEILKANSFDCRMTYLGGLGASFRDRVYHSIAMREKGRQITKGYITILVDPTSQD